MKLNIEELAKQADDFVEKQFRGSRPTSHQLRISNNQAFARLIVERCAQEAEALADKLLCVHDNDGALIALEARGNIRQLLED